MKHLYLTLLGLLATATSAMAQFYPDGRPIPPSKRGSYPARTQRSSRMGSYDRTVRYGYYPDTYYGFRLGLGLGTVHSDAPLLDATDAKAGLEASFVVGKQIVPAAPLYIESGLSYTEKGGKSTYQGQKFTYSLDYLEVPVVLKYKAYLDRDLSIDPFIGGYVACGVGGKIKDYGLREAYSSFDSNTDASFRRFDGGLKVGCALSYQMLHVGVSYDIGLANVGHYDFEDTRTGTLNLNVGVNF